MLDHECLRKQVEKVTAKQNEWFAKSIELAEEKRGRTRKCSRDISHI